MTKVNRTNTTKYNYLTRHLTYTLLTINVYVRLLFSSLLQTLNPLYKTTTLHRFQDKDSLEILRLCLHAGRKILKSPPIIGRHFDRDCCYGPGSARRAELPSHVVEFQPIRHFSPVNILLMFLDLRMKVV